MKKLIFFGLFLALIGCADDNKKPATPKIACSSFTGEWAQYLGPSELTVGQYCAFYNHSCNASGHFSEPLLLSDPDAFNTRLTISSTDSGGTCIPVGEYDCVVSLEDSGNLFGIECDGFSGVIYQRL